MGVGEPRAGEGIGKPRPRKLGWHGAGGSGNQALFCHHWRQQGFGSGTLKDSETGALGMPRSGAAWAHLECSRGSRCVAPGPLIAWRALSTVPAAPTASNREPDSFKAHCSRSHAPHHEAPGPGVAAGGRPGQQPAVDHEEPLPPVPTRGLRATLHVTSPHCQGLGVAEHRISSQPSA